MKVVKQFAGWNVWNKRAARRDHPTLPRSGYTEQPRALALGYA